MPVKANIGGCAWQEWVCIKCNVVHFDDEERAANHEIHCGEALIYKAEIFEWTHCRVREGD
jgi:hypothetical protein